VWHDQTVSSEVLFVSVLSSKALILSDPQSSSHRVAASTAGWPASDHGPWESVSGVLVSQLSGGDTAVLTSSCDVNTATWPAPRQTTQLERGVHDSLRSWFYQLQCTQGWSSTHGTENRKQDWLRPTQGHRWSQSLSHRSPLAGAEGRKDIGRNNGRDSLGPSLPRGLPGQHPTASSSNQHQITAL
jgi:hypothetical protein